MSRRRMPRWNLYAADFRPILQPVAKFWVDEAFGNTWEALKANEYWRTHPCIITNDRLQIVDNNQIDLAHRF